MKIKTCPFFINGPLHQRHLSQGAYVSSGTHQLHAMQDWDNPLHQSQSNFILLPRVKFQAELQYYGLESGRILMKDQYGRRWSIFAASADEVLPKMQLGKLTAWWVMTKKGQACGLTVDIITPLLARVPPNQDVPQMLEKATDLNTVIPYFEQMAI